MQRAGTFIQVVRRVVLTASVVATFALAGGGDDAAGRDRRLELIRSVATLIQAVGRVIELSAMLIAQWRAPRTGVIRDASLMERPRAR